jgi:YggT family protein
MFSSAPPTGPLGQILYNAEGMIVTLLIFAIIAQAILTWVAPQGINHLSSLLYDLTQPLVAPIRQIVPPVGMLDLSPLIAIILLEFLVRPVLQALTSSLA